MYGLGAATGYTLFVLSEIETRRPVTRLDCLTAEQVAAMPDYDPGNGPPVDGVNCERPCPWVSCRHHLYLDVNPSNGNVKLNFRHIDVWEMAETCSLDIADAGALTLREVGNHFDLTRERIRQLETSGMKEIKRAVRKQEEEE